ncbi:MAG: glycosyltransferase family 1 protein [Odoribacter sp.]
MVIGIDYRLAASSCRGMGRYSREIVKKLFDIDSLNQYILYIDTDCNECLPYNFRWHKLPTANYIVGEQIYLACAVRSDKLDVLWSTSNTFPLIIPNRVRLIVTIHDLIFMYSLPNHQNFTQRVGALYRRAVANLGIRRVDQVVTVSEFSAHEIKRILKIDNVVITYNCIESFYAAASNKQCAPMTDKFYFTLSADAPSKNLNFLLNVFSNRLSTQKLVVGGIKERSKLREKYKFSNIVFLKEGIDDSELIGYYQHCEAFIYVSLFEGFGIPPLEALACGAKIICSNATSLPEVVNDNGLLIDPTNEKELIEAVKNISNFEIDNNKREKHLEKFINWQTSAFIIKSLWAKKIN